MECRQTDRSTAIYGQIINTSHGHDERPTNQMTIKPTAEHTEGCGCGGVYGPPPHEEVKSGQEGRTTKAEVGESKQK